MTAVPETLSTPELLALAGRLAWARPLTPYPGWRFDGEWDSPDERLQARKAVWLRCRDRAAPAPVVVPWAEGLRLLVWLGNDVSKQVFIAGCNEPNELAFLRRVLRPGMTFIDAGANEGLFSVLAAHLVGRGGAVLAFEPSARELERLLLNLRLNGLHGCYVARAALADRAGTAQLRVAEDGHSGQNTLGDFAYRVGTARFEEVPLVRLDDVVKRRGVERVDLIKIDVEGAELALLAGAEEVLRRHRPLLLLEVNDSALTKQGGSAAALLALLDRLGYAVYNFDEETGGVTPAAGRPPTDNVVAVPREARLDDRPAEGTCRLTPAHGGA